MVSSPQGTSVVPAISISNAFSFFECVLVDVFDSVGTKNGVFLISSFASNEHPSSENHGECVCTPSPPPSDPTITFPPSLQWMFRRNEGNDVEFGELSWNAVVSMFRLPFLIWIAPCERWEKDMNVREVEQLFSCKTPLCHEQISCSSLVVVDRVGVCGVSSK
ncbi:hypothetical protein BLNAU_21423 [Blattamonas nauphoetae]|uniref:Flavin reductase like domain-containing protein n=1 Tax=Blattamonas nauphoetae TaxID=2049346 RepID=A0ABQ9X068_9EUKA|nr:hypothetical protein BLNAU_21423 [Blattamonas nauphoetae]